MYHLHQTLVMLIGGNLFCLMVVVYSDGVGKVVVWWWW